MHIHLWEQGHRSPYYLPDSLLLRLHLQKEGRYFISSKWFDLNTPELPTLQPVSDDYQWDWDVTMDFAMEETITVFSITLVADSRTVVATEPVPLPGNMERAALQLLSTRADDLNRPVP